MHSTKLVLGAALVLVGVSAQAADQGATPSSVVVIGVAAPDSGSMAAIGQDATNAVQMALDDLNARNLTIGGSRVTWKIDAQDDQGDPKQATTVAQHFVDHKVNGVVGHLNSGCTYPASRIYEQAGIPAVSPSSTDPKISRQGHKTFFRLIADDTAVGSALAHYAQENLHATRIVVIDDRTAYGQGLADMFVTHAKRRGLEIVAREYTTDKATDFSAILTRARALSPDVIVFGGVYPQAGPMLRQMRQLGVKAHLLGGDGICTPTLATLAGDAADMAVCVEGGAPVAQMPGGVAWKQRYDAKFGPDAYQIFSPYAYDATMVLAQAMIKAQSTDPARYLREIRDIHVNGVTRDDIYFDGKGNLVKPAVTVSRFEHGKKVVVSVTSADEDH